MGASLDRAEWLVALSATALYAIFAIEQHWHYQTGLDLATFTQAVEHYSRLEAPISEMKAPGFNLLGDHFHPILAILAPAYRLFPSTVTLLVAQAVIFGIAVGVVTRIGRARLGSPAGEMVGVAYALSWGIQSAVGFDFHEVAFAVPMVALSLENVLAQRWWRAALWGAALVLVKEDLPLVTAALGLILVIRKQTWLGIGLATFGIVSLFVILLWAIPFFSYYHAFTYWNVLGSSWSSVDGGLGARVVADITALANPQKILKVFMIGAVSVFACFGSVLVIVALPTLAWELLGGNPTYWSLGAHYSAIFMPIVFIAAIDTMSRTRRITTLRTAAAMLIVSLLISRWFPLAHLFSPDAWRMDARTGAAAQAVSAIPPATNVIADGRLTPHLVDRTTVYLLDKGLADSAGHPLRADWVAADVLQAAGPASPQREQEYTRALIACGWKVVYDEQGFVVLKRPSGASTYPSTCLLP